jgi:hypothetical protein
VQLGDKSDKLRGIEKDKFVIMLRKYLQYNPGRGCGGSEGSNCNCMSCRLVTTQNITTFLIVLRLIVLDPRLRLQ